MKWNCCNGMITHPMSSDYGMNDKRRTYRRHALSQINSFAPSESNHKVAMFHISSDRTDTINLLPAKWDVFTHKSTCTGGP